MLTLIQRKPEEKDARNREISPKEIPAGNKI